MCFKTSCIYEGVCIFELLVILRQDQGDMFSKCPDLDKIMCEEKS